MSLLLTGYRPSRILYISHLAASLSDRADQIYVGPNLTVPMVRELSDVAVFAGERALFIDMDGASADAQNALLRLIEDTPDGDTRFVLTVSEPTTLLPTIKSRCPALDFPPPAYVDRLKDLAEQGMSVGAASHTASKMGRGYAVEDTPTASDYARARSLFDAAKTGDIEMAATLIEGFDRLSLTALREVLVDAGDYRTAIPTFDSISPIGAAWIVFKQLRKE